MNLTDAERLANELIQKHCPDYIFVWDNAVKRFGSCDCNKKTITLSKPLTELNEESHVKNTILHEIAHALTPYHHHDAIWKRKCIEIGAIPRRCYDPSVSRPNPKYLLVCNTCGYQYRAFKKSKKKPACKFCCDKYNFGRYTEKFMLVRKRFIDEKILDAQINSELDALLRRIKND